MQNYTHRVATGAPCALPSWSAAGCGHSRRRARSAALIIATFAPRAPGRQFSTRAARAAILRGGGYLHLTPLALRMAQIPRIYAHYRRRMPPRRRQSAYGLSAKCSRSRSLASRQPLGLKVGDAISDGRCDMRSTPPAPPESHGGRAISAGCRQLARRLPPCSSRRDARQPHTPILARAHRRAW